MILHEVTKPVNGFVPHDAAVDSLVEGADGNALRPRAHRHSEESCHGTAVWDGVRKILEMYSTVQMKPHKALTHDILLHTIAQHALDFFYLCTEKDGDA